MASTHFTYNDELKRQKIIIMANKITGKVKRIYLRTSGCFLRIEYEGTQPKNSYFFLDKNHTNYNALYSLALTAAVNGYNLHVRAKSEIIASKQAEIDYFVVDW